MTFSKLINNNNSKDIFYLNYLLYLVPISIIIGNFAINLILIVISLILLIIFFLKKYKFELPRYQKTIFLSLIVLFAFNIYYSENLNHSFVSILGIVKNFLFMLSLFICLRLVKDFYKNFLFILMITLFFVGFDTLIQFFFHKDLFGYSAKISHYNNILNLKRLSGPFGDEYVVGAFISKVIFLVILYFNNIKISKYAEIIILFFFIIIFLSYERSATIMCLAGSTLFLVLNPIFNYKIKIFKIIVIFILLLSILYSNKKLTDHYINFAPTKDSYAFNIFKNFKDTQWGAHYFTAIKIFKNYPILGSGADTYRFECNKDIYENIKSKSKNIRCATHPHNIYLEILSETGLIIFIFFIFINIKILFFLSKKIIYDTSKSFKYVSLLSCYLILFNPIQTTGSFFSTWNGIFYWLFFAFLIFETQFNIKKIN